MKSFILKTILFILIPTTILAFSLFFIPNTKIPDNSLYANIDKQERIKTLKGKRIILVGGSNLAFGVISPLIEKELGIPVVNMGLHAGLGINYILSEVEDYIHKEDIVIVSPEYHHFTSRSMYNGEDVLVALAFDVNRECMKHIKTSQWISLLPQIFLYSSKKLINLSNNPVDSFEQLFNRGSFNMYGDEVAHYGLPSAISSGHKETLKKEISYRSIKRLKTFQTHTKSKGATLIITACPYPEKQYSKDSAIINSVSCELEKAGLHLSIKPQECLLPDSMMFNSYFHPTKEGAEIRTRQLIHIIKENVDQN